MRNGDGKIWQIVVDYGQSQIVIEGDGRHAAVGQVEDVMDSFFPNAYGKPVAQSVTIQRVPLTEATGERYKPKPDVGMTEADLKLRGL